MSELSPDARDLIAQARKQRAGPSPEQRAELREKLAPLWAAQAARPSALGRLRWKIGSLALLASLGLIGWLYTQAAVEPQVLQTSPPLPTRTDPAPCPHGSSLRAGACVPEAPASTGSVASSDQPLPELCPRGSSARAGACVPEAPASTDSVATSGQPLTAAAPRKANREGPVARKAQQPPAASTPDSSSPDARQRDESAGRKRSAGARGQDAQLGNLSLEAADERARTDANERAGRQPARLPVRAGERTPARVVQTDTDPGPPSIDGELELLGAAQSALHKQRPSRALTLLQEHAFRFPSGAMVEERMAMQALALCALQRRHAARTVLANMEARGSQSQLLPRVRSQCGL